MATAGNASVKVTVDLDLETLQKLGWAARAVELAQQDCATVDTAFNTYLDARDVFEGMDERHALMKLMACCLARLWEIR